MRALVACLTLLLAVVAVPVRADRSDARDLVAQAQGMLQNPTPEQLAKAEAKIREAILEHAEPVRGNLLRGGDYFPYFHLGGGRDARRRRARRAAPTPRRL